ncbi:MAG: GNAT family N-acetyltransferase [Cyclobacteriaceae bacterium]|jgi:GNAT superfamily N-acetyltransferase|nr:GNAT family N-acetyltransferase [Cyclobacteriaceae bacterium]
MEIEYRNDRPLTTSQFIDILRRSTLALRRPVDNPGRIEKMLKHANVLITAWDGDRLVGVSRALTDFAYCCYLSDLAVDEAYQRRGIGKRLIEETHNTAGREVRLILLAAPAAVDYYPKVGLQKFPNCYTSVV